MTKPNILLVMCDQLSALATSPYGNPDVLTPNMQALADRGMLFRQSYCNSPLCAPSRASMFTGMLSGRLPVNDNAEEFPAATPTFAHLLRHGGYATSLSGKMHFVGPDQLHGLEERLTTDIYPSDYSWVPRWREQPQWARIRDGAGDSRIEDTTPLMAERICNAGPVRTCVQVNYDEETHFRALERLRQLAADAGPARQPWFLCVSYTQPHDPYTPLHRYWGRYDSVDIRPPMEPPQGYQPHTSDLWNIRWHGVDSVAPTTDDALRTRRGYYAMTSYIDDKLGELVDELDRLRLSDDTVVIFTSDHGDMVGEHGMYFKRSVREWSARVPLIVAGGGVTHGEVDVAVSLVDLFPTLVDLTGTPWPDAEFVTRLDGTTLEPLLHGRPDHVDARHVVIENNGEGTIEPIRAVVADGMKFISVHGEADQLYDLTADPHEWHNLAGTPPYADVERRLRALCCADWDSAETERRVLESQERRHFLRQALAQGSKTAWDMQPRFDATRMYVRPHLKKRQMTHEDRQPGKGVR